MKKYLTLYEWFVGSQGQHLFRIFNQNLTVTCLLKIA